MNVYRRRRWTALAATLVAVVAIGKLLTSAGGEESPTPATPGVSVAGEDEPKPRIERTVVGRGASSAKVIRLEGVESASAVIFLHGWQLVGPRDYRSWFTHLARAGNAVIVPRYQGAETPPDRVLAKAVRGIRRGFELVGEVGSTIVAGHSAGAALAVDYSATAAAERLPVPDAALAIYPGRAILGYPAGIPAPDLAEIPASMRLVVMYSPTDLVVGEQPAKELFAAAVAVPENRKRLVAVTEAKAADHYAPIADSRAARKVFWGILDRLVDRVRRDA